VPSWTDGKYVKARAPGRACAAVGYPSGTSGGLLSGGGRVVGVPCRHGQCVHDGHLPAITVPSDRTTIPGALQEVKNSVDEVAQVGYVWPAHEPAPCFDMLSTHGYTSFIHPNVLRLTLMAGSPSRIHGP